MVAFARFARFACWVATGVGGFAVGCGGGGSSQSPAGGGAGGASGISSSLGGGGSVSSSGRPSGGASDAGAAEGGAADGGTADGGTADGGAGNDNVGDDGIDCTFDDCSSGQCQHTPLHFRCADGKYCSPTEGCVAGAACAVDADCFRPDACTAARCDVAKKRCIYTFLDGDHDGDAPESCGGTDCDDSKATVRGAGSEVCDLLDNDCDGVVDPPTASDCGDGKSCTQGKCDCLAPNTLCSGACVATKSDPMNCGVCGKTCQANETCEAGLCTCTTGLTKCAGTCVDLSQNHDNCGACGKKCGDGVCAASACSCQVGTTSCGSSGLLSCKDTSADANNCGGCNKRCMGGALCENSGCDVTLQWMKLYGVQQASDPVGHSHQAKMITDSSGNLLVALALEPGTVTALPNGLATLWSNQYVLAKFGPNGDFIWAVPAGNGVTSMAAVGSDFWVANYTTVGYPITLAGQAFAVASGYQAATALVKISGVNGSVLDYFQLDATSWNTSSQPKLKSIGSNVWLADVSKDLKRGSVSWAPPSANYTSYLYPLGGEPLWLPGYLSSLSVDTDSKLVVDLSLPAGATFLLGGQTFTTAPNEYRRGVARYSPSLVPQSAKLVDQDGLFVTGSSTLTFMKSFTLPASELFYRYDAAGVLTKTGLQGPFNASQARSESGRLFMIGNGSSGEGSYYGHSIGVGYPGVLLTFAEDTLKFQRAARFSLELGSSYGYGRVEDVVITDGGNSVILSVIFKRGITVDQQSYDFGGSAIGFGLIKLALH